MKEILALIEKKKEDFARLPFFEYLRDSSIDPRQRLAFAHCVAPFVMAFGELNKDVFRQEPTTDPIQKIINKHTYEDDHHWVWYLEDIKTLGIDRTFDFTDTLNFLWGEETKAGRKLSNRLYGYALQAAPIQKLVIIEVIEATGNILFSLSSQIIVRELRPITKKNYLYFGEFHLAVETGRITGVQQEEQLILENIKLTHEDLKEACDLVEKVFELFTEFTHELLAYAKAQNISQISTETEKSDRFLQTV
ncbi:MAG: hypothetical protein ACFBSE_19865 [Prochloraceae cyanobacterium]